MAPKSLPSITVFNSSEETIEILKIALEEQGYAVSTGHVAEAGKNQREGVFRHGVFIGARRDAYRNTMPGGGWHIDGVVSHAGPGDRTQARRGKHTVVIGLDACNHRVDPAQQLNTISQRHLHGIDIGINHIEAGGIEDIPIRTGLPVKYRGTDENTRHAGTFSK